jgi:tetratricopeptide (TPR) repeat protein
MNNNDPDGGGGAGAGGGAGGGGTTDPGGGGGGGGMIGAPPTITPPNLDPDPAQAKVAVDMHLKNARAALSGSRPDPDAAIKDAKLALQIDAASVDAAVVMAHAYYLKRLVDTAEVMLDEVFKRQTAKSNAGLFYVYGLIYDRQNKKNEALLAYKKAVELDPGHISAHINLGVHQLANKQYAEAIETYEKVKGARGNDPEVWNSLGAAYRGKSGDFQGAGAERDRLLQVAEQSFKRAIELDRSHGPAYYNLGVLYLDADPFPGGSGPQDTLVRLNNAKAQFNSYKSMPGVDMKLFEERMKDVDKLIKREEKKRKREAKEKAKGG